MNYQKENTTETLARFCFGHSHRRTLLLSVLNLMHKVLEKDVGRILTNLPYYVLGAI